MVTCTNCGIDIQGEFKFCPSCGTKIVAAPAPETSLIGTTLTNKYRVLSEIGSGSMGTVYLAEHIGLKKQVAIKVLRSDLQVSEESLRRFQREGIAAGKFNHPNAIQIFDFDRAADDTFFLAMEYINGSNLKEIINREDRLDLATAVSIIGQVLRALDEAHRGGIIHRDLKPENIMVAEGGNGAPMVKVLDFGLSKLVDLPEDDSYKTQVGRILGSPRYMAPEQCAGNPVDHRIDLYAAGLILFEMLSGQSPSPANTLTELLMKRINEPPPSLIDKHPDLDISKGLDEFLHKALETDPGARYQSAAEMIAALEAALDPSVAFAVAGQSALEMRPRGKRGRSTAGARQRPARAVPVRFLAGGAVVIAVAVVVFLILTQGGSSESTTASLVSLKSPEDRTDLENRYVSLLLDAGSRLAERDFDAALAATEEMVRMECADAEVYLVRGSIYLERGDLDMARADFEEAVRSTQGYAAAEAGLGWVHLAKDDLDSAMRCFERAVQIDGRCVQGLTGQGAVHFGLGDLAKATEVLESVFEIDPADARSAYYLGSIRLREGDLDAAVEDYVRAVRNDPRAPDPYTGLGEVYRLQGDAEQAERQFREALELDPAALEANIALAALLVEEERFSEAQPLLEEGIRRHSGEGKLHILQGVTREAEGLDAEAISSLRRGIELTPEDPEARIFLGILYQREERYSEALEQYRAAAELDSTSAQPLLNQGLVLFMLERYEEAGQALRRAASIDGDNPFIHYNLGIVYSEYLGESAWALEHLLRYEALGGLDAARDRRVRRLLASMGY